jgi:hypothetical protein
MGRLLLEAVVVVACVAWVYFAGRLAYVVIGGMWVVRRATSAARVKWHEELANLTSEEIRARLLHESYFSNVLRADPGIQTFLARIARGDEVALAAEYPRAKLYRLLASAERATGATGRPEAVDAIGTISGLLQELAKRTSHTNG